MIRKALSMLLILMASMHAALASSSFSMKLYGLSDGEIHEVDEGGVLFSGDSFQLTVQAETGLFVYVFLDDSSGELVLLNPEVGGAKFYQQMGSLLELPGEEHWYRLDDHGGEETLIVVGAKDRIDLEVLEKVVKKKDWGYLKTRDVEVKIRSFAHIKRSLVTRSASVSNGSSIESPEQYRTGVDSAVNKADKYLSAKSMDSTVAAAMLEKSQQQLLEETFVTRGVKEVHLFKKAAPAVLLIVAGDSIGSGSLLTRTGIVLTNWHVVAGKKRVEAAFMPKKRGKVRERDLVGATVLKTDEVSDLALIKLDSVPSDIEPLELGNIEDVDIGQDVHAIGHPKGEYWSYTKGYISQLRADYEWEAGDKTKKNHHVDLIIQTQTPINPGNSGGPLLTDDGLVVGVNSFVLSGADGLNYAVSVDDVRAFINRDGNRVAKVVKSEEEELSEILGVKVVYVEREDVDGDGKKEMSIYIDGNRDQKIDKKIVVAGTDSSIIAIVHYSDYEAGQWEELILDSNNDGKLETHLYDLDGDGKEDMIGYDDNDDGKVDRYEKV